MGLSPSGSAPADASVALHEASCFPVDLHVPERRFGMRRVDVRQLEESVFLDNRMQGALEAAMPVPVHRVAESAVAASAPAWLFHTSFCCSTLLSRALHVPPHEVVLKEPLVLRRLSDARHAGWPIDELVLPTLRLLSRPWHPGGSVVVKPTHAALNIGTALTAATPESRCIVLTSSLEDFVLSNMKKTPETRQKIPVLAERALQAGRLRTRLPAGAYCPPDLSAAAALQWAAQRDLCLDMLEGASGRFRVLDATDLLADFGSVVARCAKWLDLPVPEDVLRARVRQVAGAHAKDTGVAYNPVRREREAEHLRAAHASELQAALAWFDRFVRPAMLPGAIRLDQVARRI